jgi:hypothetical protein
MPTSTERADAELDRLLRKAPSRVANASRNARTGRARHRRWEPARDALWDFVGPVLEDGARVAIVGAGNCDTVPLRRIAARADAVALIDIDPRAAEAARRRIGRRDRRRVKAIGHDVTGGAADEIATAAVDLAAGRRTGGRPDPGAQGGAADLDPVVRTSGRSRPDGSQDGLPGAPYELVVGDLFYSQLLYPALLDLGVDADSVDATIAAHGPPLTRAVVARLQASAPLVVHVHDPLAWWDGHEQPVALAEILEHAAEEGPEAALALAARGSGPYETDPRGALPDLGLSPASTALWHWPFAPGVDYLACATLVPSTR